MSAAYSNSLEPPFSSFPDPRFFFSSRQHDEALTTLLTGIATRTSLLILTGERGVGKTTLCRILLDRLDHHIKRSFIFQTPPTPTNLAQQIHDDFGLPTTGNAVKDRDDVLHPFLVRNRLEGGDATIIVDDAHLLSSDCLDAIGTLFQPEPYPEQLLQVVLVGELSLIDALTASTVPMFAEAATTCYHLEPLEHEDLKDYIAHRCRVAGWRGDIPLSVGAFTKIYQESGGIPGTINQICAATFESAEKQGTLSITDDLIVLGKNEAVETMHATVSAPSVAASPPVTQEASQRLPWHLRGGLIAVVIGVLGFGVWLGWVMKPEDVAVNATITPVASVSTASTTPTPPTEPSSDYGFDLAGIVRTDQESHTAQAAMLTLLNQWSRLQQPDAKHPASGPETMRIDSFPFKLSLLERLDYPTVITWRAKDAAPLTSAVLFALGPETATIVDPLHGVVQVKREQLPERVVGDVKIAWQPLPGVFPPFQGAEKTQSLETLQYLLGQLGFGTTTEHGTREELTEEGIRELQQFYGFEPTGVFSKEVHLVLAKEMHGQQVPSLMFPPSLSPPPDSAN